MTSIIKVAISEKLNIIREQNNNIIQDNFLFTFQNSNIPKSQENNFSIGDIMNDSHIVILKNINPKIKIKIIEDNKSVISEQIFDPLAKLSELRKDLGIEN